MASTRSPTLSSSMLRARSAWLTMPIRSCPSITGRRRTLCSAIVCSASSTESSAPIVTGLPSPSSPARVDAGSLPCASTFTTMSRSLSMPLSRLSSPQIGIAPTLSSASRLAASRIVSFSPMHSAPPVMTSRAVLPMWVLPWVACAARYPLAPGSFAPPGVILTAVRASAAGPGGSRDPVTEVRVQPPPRHIEPAPRMTIVDLLAAARRRLRRVAPQAVAGELAAGAVLVDIRSQCQRERDGVIPGAVFHPRNVLEWRVDPASGHSDPSLSGDLRRRIILVCDEGYQSSLAAGTLQDLGFVNATDLDGGF